MKFSNLDIQEIQKTGAAYIPVSLTYVDSNKNVKDSLLCVHDDKGVLDNGKNVVHEGTEKEYALQLLTAHKNMVERTKSILKTLKEKAIDAANDSNTDADRAIIQKEVDQALDQIDENANVTFNGTTLIDGSKNDQVIGESGTGTHTYLTNESFADGTKARDCLVDMKRKDGTSLGIQPGDRITVSYIKDGKTYSNDIDVTDTLMFGKILDWTPCKTDLDIVNYSDSSMIGKDRMGEDVYTADGLSAISYHAQNPGVGGQISGLTICVMDSKGNPRTSANATINNFHETIRAEDPSDDNALIFQTGTKANQSVKIGFTDMRATALGLRAKDGSTIFNKSFAFVFNPKKLLDEAKTIKFFSCSSYYDAKAENGNGRKISLSSRTAPLVFEDGTEISSEMTIFDVAQKYGTSILDKKVKDVASVVSIDRDKRILYEDVTRALLYAEKSMPGDNYRDNIKNLIGNLFDNAIEKCDMSIDSNKKHRKEILATKK